MIALIVSPKSRGSKKTIVAIASLSVAFLIAIFLDVPLSGWAHDSGLAAWLKISRS